MRGLAFAALLIAATTSCDPEAARVVEACSVICDCQPAGGDECFTECVDEVANQASLSDACLACVSDHRDRCLSIEVDCDDTCGGDDNPPQPGEPNPEPPVVVDAGVPVDSF
jgi:hypothetical protein